MIPVSRTMSKRWVAALLALCLAAWPSVGMGHLDPPGPPGLEVTASAIRLDLTADQDDGLDGNAELLLAVNVTHEDHGQTTVEFEKDDYNWDANVGWVLTPSQIWSHPECSPRNIVTVGTVLVEMDSTKTAQVVDALASAAAGAAIGTYFGGLPGTIGGAVVGFGISLITALNGNDILGVGSAAIPANGPRTVNSVGPDGGADIQFSGLTTPYNEPNCAAAPPQPGHLTPGERTQRVFTPLEKALAPSAQVEAEEGNPAALSGPQVEEIRRTLARTTLGVAELFAAVELLAAQGFAGAEAAMEFYLTARALTDENPAKALELFGAAFLKSATARANGVRAEQAPIPMHIALTGDFLTTRAGRTANFLALVPGAGGEATLSLAGLPAAMGVQVSRLSPVVPLFRIEVKVGEAQPGQYAATLTAQQPGGPFATRALTIAVNPDPPAYHNGVDLPAETDGDVTFAVINPLRDQAFGPAGGAFRLKIPAGSIGGAEAAVSVKQVAGADLAELLAKIPLPRSARSLGRAFLVGAEAEAGPVGSFERSLSLEARAGLERAARVEQAGLYRLENDGTWSFAGGRVKGGALHGYVERPGLYVMAEVSPAFADMQGHWAAADVALMASKQIVRGVAPDRFDPAGQVTRAQFAALLVRATGLKQTSEVIEFTDVKPTDWFYNEVMTAAAAGLVKGMGDGSFAPNASVTREQVAVMLARALTQTGKAAPVAGAEAERILSIYEDRAQVSGWAAAELALAIRTGIMRGFDGNLLAPGARASRAEAAVMIARFWR